LEALIRKAISKPTGDILPADVATLTYIPEADYSTAITNLGGIECLTNLERVEVSGNKIGDLAPIAGMPHLWLVQASWNRIENISVLADLPLLQQISLDGNPIDDQDLAVLRNVSTLKYVVVSHTQITDLTPLVDNAAFAGTGSGLWAYDIPIDCTAQAANLQALRTRGVNVLTDCDAGTTGGTGGAGGSGGAGGASSAAGGTGGTSTGCAGTVSFADPGLEAAVRVAIDKPAGDIVASDVENLEALNAVNRNIGNLAGLECLTGLAWLNLTFNRVDNLAALGNLKGLKALILVQNEQHGDLGPIGQVTSLQELVLSTSFIADLTSLGSLTNLRRLDLQHMSTSDLRPLATLTKLLYLDLRWNSITDITALSNLTSLASLSLQSNSVSDISPLVGNAGLGDGDQVAISQNPVDCTAQAANLQMLRTRGVDLFTDCP
jgi:internalin A